jgi:copper oxidase (laccase) domain-containing protein
MAPALALGPAMVRFTGRAEGHLGSGATDAARRAVVDLPWVAVHQVHGARVVDESGAGDEADAIVIGKTGVTGKTGDTGKTAMALAVFTADCAPVMLASPEGPIAAAHAGWRGLLEGVLPATVSAMRRAGAVTIEAALGPCIHPECYEFSAGDLALLALALGDEVRGRTSGGQPALDVPAAVRAALAGVDVELTYDAGVCTACSAEHFSHRARKDAERQAGVIWIP